MTISKEIKFDCAHMLSKYNGKCHNLHGHTYHGTVTLTSDHRENDSRMVVDYNHIKNVVDTFDHAVIFSSKQFCDPMEEELRGWAIKYDSKRVDMPEGCKTTAEDLVMYMIELFKELSVTDIVIELSETDGSWAKGEWHVESC